MDRHSHTDAIPGAGFPCVAGMASLFNAGQIDVGDGQRFGHTVGSAQRGLRYEGLQLAQQDLRDRSSG